MKNLFNTGVYIVLLSSVIYLGINGIKSNKTNKQLALGVSELKINQIINQNLINVERQSWQIEYLLKQKGNQNVLEKIDNLTIPFSDLVKNDSLNLYFFLHENSCSSCLETEFNNIKYISDSLKIPINFICMSESWRFIKLLQQNYNMENKFYRIEFDDKTLNDELFLSPFYFLIDRESINHIFFPLKENPGRTNNYLKFIIAYYS